MSAVSESALENKRAYQRRWQRNNPDRGYRAHRKRVLARYEIMAELKAQPCSICGGEFPAVAMDWHHRDPATKLFSISGSNLARTWASIETEMAKCDLICANCHRVVSQEDE